MHWKEALTRKRPPAQMVFVLVFVFFSVVIITGSFYRDPTIVLYTIIGIGVPVAFLCGVTILCVFMEALSIWRKLHRR